MRILAIETASEACSLALFEGSELVAHDHRVLGRGHAEHLVPMIGALPNKGQADRILVSLGPGSFTGVRIGLAAARALGVAWQAEVLGYPTLRLIHARGWQSEQRAITVCVNGGHGEWFVQSYGSDGAPEGDVQSLKPEEVCSAGTHDLVVGNRAEECAELFADGRAAMVIGPDARACALLTDRDLTPDLRPIYGRAPDATPQKQVRA